MGKAKQRRTADGGEQRREERVVGRDGGVWERGFWTRFYFYFFLEFLSPPYIALFGGSEKWTCN